MFANMLIFMHNDEMSMFSLSCPDHNCITDAHMTHMEGFKLISDTCHATIGNFQNKITRVSPQS